MPKDGNTSSQIDDLPLAINSLSYAYPGSLPVISDFTLNLPRGSRCLLLGANGAGNTRSSASLQTKLELSLRSPVQRQKLVYFRQKHPVTGPSWPTHGWA